MRVRRWVRGFGVHAKAAAGGGLPWGWVLLQLVQALVVLGGTWLALPTRWWLIDGLGTALGFLWLLSAWGLVKSSPWRIACGAWAAGLTLLAGLVVLTLLGLSVGQLVGLYGPVGRGGAVLLLAVALFLLPYLVVFPAWQLLQLYRRQQALRRGGAVLGTSARWLLILSLALSLEAIVGTAVLRAFLLRTPLPEAPPKALVDWSFRVLHEGGKIAPPGAGDSFRGLVIVLGWRGGQVVFRAEHRGGIVAALRASEAARRRLAQAPEYWTLSLIGEERSLGFRWPLLEELAVVPLREGLVFRLHGKTWRRTPDELWAALRYDHGRPTGVPDFDIGFDWRGAFAELGQTLGVPPEELRTQAEVRRFAARTLREHRYPRSRPVDAQETRAAAEAALDFLLRHQWPEGRFTYLYQARSDLEVNTAYSLTRHAGSAYFLAQSAALLHSPKARLGAEKAMRWLEGHGMRNCGPAGHWCIVQEGQMQIGAVALGTLAASELVLAGSDAQARRWVEGLSQFLRAQQRPDGELMHEFDLATQRPIDVQHLYYSGEAALALLRAYRALGDRRDLEAARRLLAHLSGKHWDFFGSRYYFGEEHWTCMAAGEAQGLLPVDDTLRFCERWAEYNRALQYRAGETFWPVDGAYGVGTLWMPRLTPVATRAEAFISTYEALRAQGRESPELRRQIERSLGMLMRWQWRPGPVHLFAEPRAAEGAWANVGSDFLARNDFAQHAGSALLRWSIALQGGKHKEISGHSRFDSLRSRPKKPRSYPERSL